MLTSLLVGLTFATGLLVAGLELHALEQRRGAVRRAAIAAAPAGACLRVTRDHGTFIHLATHERSTLCGLPWNTPADPAAEVDAFLGGLDRPAAMAGATCPVCADRAGRHVTIT